jgi:hypothetical protein
MNIRTKQILPFVAIGLLIGAPYSSNTIAKDGASVSASAELEDAARAVLMRMTSLNTQRKADVEDVYHWSMRVKDAESARGNKKKPIADHISRMKALNERAEALHKQGSKGGELATVEATKYYLIEARLLNIE